MEGERPALIDAVVEHGARAGIGNENVLLLPGEDIVVGTCGLMRGGAAGMLAPEPLGVAGKALVEPNIAPGGQAQGIAKPLVGELVGDEPLEAAVRVVGAEDGKALGLQRDLELVLGDDDLVIVEGISAVGLREKVKHLLLLGEGLADLRLELRRGPGAGIRPKLHLGELAHHDRGEVRRHGVRGPVMPARHRSGALVGDELAIAHDGKRGVRRDDDVVGRFRAGRIIAREPAGRAARLARHEGARLRLLPADLAPCCAQRARGTTVTNNKIELRSGGELIAEGDTQLAVRLAELRDMRALRAYAPGDHRSCKVHGELVQRLVADAQAQRGLALETIGLDVIGELEAIMLDGKTQVVLDRSVRIAGRFLEKNARAGERVKRCHNA